MNPIAHKYGAAGLAAVNLVPSEISERRKLRSVRFMAVVAVLIAVGAVIVLYLGALGATLAAQSGLDEAIVRQSEAFEKRDAKAPVYDAYVTRETEELALAQAGWGEIDLSQFLLAVANEGGSDNSALQSLVFFGPSALGFGGSEQDFVFGAGIGSIEYSALTSSAEEATALIARLEAVPGLASVRGLAEQFEGDEGDVFWQVRGTALVTPTVLTLRIFPAESVTGITPESIDAIVRSTGGEEVATPTEEPSAEPTAAPTAESEG